MTGRFFCRVCFVLSALLIPTAAIYADSWPVSPQTIGIDRDVQLLESQLGDLTVAMKLFTVGQESGVLTLYPTVDGTTKLVVQFVSGETGKVSEFYFRDKSLFYAVDACKSFDSAPPQGSADKGRSVSEDRYYFSDGRLICWLSGQGGSGLELREASADQADRESTGNSLAERAARWLAFARSPVEAPGAPPLANEAQD